MGTLTVYDFEGTPGATISATGLALVGGGSAVYDAAVAVIGSTGAKFTNSTGNVRAARITWPVPLKTRADDFFVTIPPTLPGAGVRWILASLRRTLPSPGTVVQIQVNENGAIGWEAGSSGFIATSANLAAGTKVRVLVRAVVGVSTTDGLITVKCFLSGANWTTQTGTTKTQADAAGGVLNLGTTEITGGDFGMVSNPATAVPVGIDYIRDEDARTTDFGAPPTASAPTAAASATSQYPEVGDTVTLSAAGSVAGTGSITGYSWVCTTPPDGAAAPSITNPTTATATFVPAVGSRYVFTLTVTQTGGMTDTATVVVYPHAHSSEDVGVYDVTLGLWSSEGSPPAATPKVALNDPSATNYLKSPTNPAGQVCGFTMDSYGPGSISVLVTGNWTGGVLNRTVIIYMEDGVTELANETYALTSVEVEHEVILNSGALTTATVGVGRRALKGTMADA